MSSIEKETTLDTNPRSNAVYYGQDVYSSEENSKISDADSDFDPVGFNKPKKSFDDIWLSKITAHESPNGKKRSKKNIKNTKNTTNDNIDIEDELDPELVALVEGRRSESVSNTKSTKEVPKVSPTKDDDIIKITNSEIENDDVTIIKTSSKIKANEKETSKKETNQINKNANVDEYNISEIKKLAEKYPNTYWKERHAFPEQGGPIDFIDADHPLRLLPTSISDQGPITGIQLSQCGEMLATFSNTGFVKIWDTNTFSLLRKLKDPEEANIEEFYVGQFTPDSKYVITGGKLKDRKMWSNADEDNHILPCPLKVFDILTGECVARLSGHTEEIICVKRVVYKETNYWITTSQDGFIRRWPMKDDWITPLEESKAFVDGVSCMVFSVSFVPNTGNRFFVAACDERVKLFDMEACKVVQTFDQIYSSYCDCVKFIEPLENLEYQPQPQLNDENDEVCEIIEDTKAETGDGSIVIESQEMQVDTNDAETKTIKEESLDNKTETVCDEKPKVQNTPELDKKVDSDQNCAYLLTRGVELLDSENNTVSSIPNTVTLHKLVFPSEDSNKFELVEIRRFHNEEYLSNSWLIRIVSNGRYVLAPTYNGLVFVFHLSTGKLAAILRDHQSIEVRDAKFHPFRKMLFTSSDDGSVMVYSQEKDESTEQLVNSTNTDETG
ncbi:hypothetical protein BB558_001352 [Smittium angustum]|uniref:Uncharacterized protein n=1 Tax=Smittium angustum TaxID=133377 RepID=A0A2U1JBQ6_SMIAN|nr:hypothetical protein BB558_001352 [Smittium angustum]